MGWITGASTAGVSDKRVDGMVKREGELDVLMLVGRSQCMICGTRIGAGAEREKLETEIFESRLLMSTAGMLGTGNIRIEHKGELERGRPAKEEERTKRRERE